MVSGSLSLPSRGAFHLSLTVLCAIGHQGVFSLGRWSSRLPTGFLVSCGTLDSRPLSLPFAYGAVTLYGLTFQTCSTKKIRVSRVHNPEGPQTPGLGSFHFARRYFGNRCFFLFLRLLRCFSSPGSLLVPYLVQARVTAHYDRRVSPFGHPRINACLRLPVAFRSLPRPSSALGAKASTIRPL